MPVKLVVDKVWLTPETIRNITTKVEMSAKKRFKDHPLVEIKKHIPLLNLSGWKYYIYAG